MKRSTNTWDRECKYLLLYLLFFSVVHFIAGFIFFQGFLLMRYEVPNKSECNNPPIKTELELFPGTNEPGCWLPATYKHAVILIIDALRFDFVVSPGERTNPARTHYHHRLPIFRELHTQQPEHSFLFQFIADSPTTTMQRLKGLTTGSLPTFIDAGSNFGSSAIFEDNIIHQLGYYNSSTHEGFSKKVHFYGDDTWASLFPHHFHENISFPSFNVKDLHTVDNGVISNLIPAMRTKFRHPKARDLQTGAGDLPNLVSGEWDVLIGHMLGVDHVGHRHGPDHPAMSSKLAQVDDVIREIVEILQNGKDTSDTILFVMGDHGMTSSGDHGGASDDELASALFVYSPRPFGKFPIPKTRQFPKVPQIDFVPTFSLLLGIPIPYGNLGGIIPELFLGADVAEMLDYTEIKQMVDDKKIKNEELQGAMWRLNSAMRVNILQIRRYLETYSTISHSFQKRVLADLDDKIREADAIYKEIEYSWHAGTTTPAQAQRHEILYKMYADIQREIIEICRNVWATFDLDSMTCGLVLMVLSCASLVTVVIVDARSFPLKLFLGFSVLGVMTSFAQWAVLQNLTLSLIGYPVFGALCGLTIGLIWTRLHSPTQSLVLSDAPQQYLLTSASVIMVILHAVGLFSNSYIEAQDKTVRFLANSLLFLHFIALIKHKALPKLLFKCLVAMVIVKFTLSEWSHTYKENFVSSDQLLINSLVTWGWCLPAFIYILNSTLRAFLNPKELRPFWVQAAQGSVYFGLIGIAGYWLVLQSRFVDSLPWWGKSIFPWMTYASSIRGISVLFFSHKKDSHKDELFLRLTLLIANFGTTVLLLSGPSSAQNILLLFIQCILFCQMTHFLRGSSIHTVIAWGFFTLQYYFATGHDFSFTKIQWSSAYVGFEENLLIRSAILTILNTFSSPFLFTLFLPLLVLYSHGVSSRNPHMKSHAKLHPKSHAKSREKYSALSPSNPLPSEKSTTLSVQSVFGYLRTPLLLYMLFFTINTTSTIAFVYIARHHLMVWRIFAPKYLFESCFLLVVDWTLVVSVFIVRNFAAKKKNLD